VDKFAYSFLTQLLSAGEMSKAGRRSRQASITKSQLADYRSFTSLLKKEAFEETMRAAQACGAVELVWDDTRPGSGFIQRINLLDLKRLAQLLGIRPVEDSVEEARNNLWPFIPDFPVVEDVLNRWASLRKVRGLGPESYANWKYAVETIKACRKALSTQSSVPVREFSNQLFRDSKRIEKLVGPLDILLSGSLDSEIRGEPAVLQELGLYREEHPARLSGQVIIEREHVTAFLDTPYCGLPASTIVRLASKPALVMTIENLTTFHSEARKRYNEEILLIYTAGMPSPAWRSMYRRLLCSLPADVPVYHWGDVDEGGFRIAATLARDAESCGHKLLPWKMHPNDIPESLRRKASRHTLERIRLFSAQAGWESLGEAVVLAEFTVEQESI
jgi:hypothetical protein